MPEAVNTMSQGKSISHYSEQQDPFVLAMKKIARFNSIWLHLGSVIVSERGKLFNRTLMIDDQGEIAQSYDKINMFDVDLSEQGEKVVRESDSYTPGDKITYANCPWGRTGLSICYDLRFPNLYRQLAQSGCKIMLVPAAFTQVTGSAHWHVLLRARAIENSAWVVAAAQCGEHQDGRKTYGHSMIVDPWGNIVVEAGDNPEVITATIDLTKADKIRSKIPAWRH